MSHSFTCPFKACRRQFKKHQGIREHASMIKVAMGDENHSQADSNWDALQLFSKSCVRLTRDQQLENNRASKCNYERKRIDIRLRSRYPITLSETDLQRVCAIPAQDIAFQSTRVSNDKMENGSLIFHSHFSTLIYHPRRFTQVEPPPPRFAQATPRLAQATASSGASRRAVS